MTELRKHGWVLAFVCSAVAACGGAALPAESLTSAQSAVRAAEVGDAETHPQASLHLKYARDQIEEAKRLIEDGDNERAKYVLERAEADAAVALGIARERAARAEADKAIAELAELKQKLEKK